MLMIYLSIGICENGLNDDIDLTDMHLIMYSVNLQIQNEFSISNYYDGD